LAKLGVLVNPTNAGAPAFLANVNDAARRSDIRVVVAEVTHSKDFDGALALLGTSRPDALLVMIEPMIYLNRDRVLDFVAAQRLPASFDVGREIVRQGGLISYGPVLTAHYAFVAEYVDKVLRGTDPATLPIQQPTEFALVINLKTAKTLDLNVPQSLLARADEIIK
jgi:putative ABC transport system substrate-binding protein